jgi:hypothetical protein
MKLSFDDPAAAVADPLVKAGVEKGIAVSSGIGEGNADMVEATLSLVTSRRLSAEIRRLSSSSVHVDFEINIPSQESATIDADNVADSLASADQDSLNSALSDAIASVASATYSVAVAELPSVDPIGTSTPVQTPQPTPAPEPTPQPTPAPTAPPVYVMLQEEGICEAPGYETTVTSIDECALLCDTTIVGCAYFSYSSGACKLTDKCDEVIESSEYSVYKLGELGNGDTLNSTPGGRSGSIHALFYSVALLACLRA